MLLYSYSRASHPAIYANGKEHVVCVLCNIVPTYISGTYIFQYKLVRRFKTRGYGPPVILYTFATA